MALRNYAFLVLGLATCLGAQGGIIQQYQATLFGSGGVPTTPGVIGNTLTPGFGFLAADFDVDQNLLTVKSTSSFLTSGNAIAFLLTGPFTGTNTGATQLTLAGIPNSSSGSVPTQSFLLTSTQVAQLQAGAFYALIQTSAAPLGEVGGSLVQTGQTNSAPEPSTVVLSGLGFALLLVARLRN